MQRRVRQTAESCEIPIARQGTGPTTPPEQLPGEDWEWRGKEGSQPGDKEGAWYNEGLGESLHPNLDHEDPIGPHGTG